MAKQSEGGTTNQTKTSSLSMTDFIKDPAGAYAKVQSGERLILTGERDSDRIVIYPGTLADYGSPDES